MSPADLVVFATVLTVDDARPAAEALAVAGDRIAAVGDRAEITAWIGPPTRVIEAGDAAVLPGFVEAHSHPLFDAVVCSGRMLDIRPVTIADGDAVVDALRAAIADNAPDAVYAVGWDRLLQPGLPEPRRDWLDALAPQQPLVIVHNSGHRAYFNTAAARAAGIDRHTPDPDGASYGRDEAGDLDGTADEAGAVFPLLADAIADDAYPAMLRDESARLNAAGLTTCAELAFEPRFTPLLAAARDELTVRLRTYEIAGEHLASDAAPGDGDDMLRAVGIKVWVDGSPWVGNIDASFGYLDTDATRRVGVAAGRCGHANYTAAQLTEIVEAYFPLGWQIAAHVHGDLGVETILDVYEAALARHPRPDHRLRLEHVGAIGADQLHRAAALGVTASMFVSHLHYWGDVLVDGLFGAEHGARWMPTASAIAAGMRISLHNDAPVTPAEPLRNIAVAATRTAPSGRVLAPQERISVESAIRAETIDAAWQLFADDVIGSLRVGKYADLVVVSADPRTVAPEAIAELDVLATFVAGRQVYG